MKNSNNSKNNMAKIALLFILLVVSSANSFATTYRTSTGSGSWTTSGMFSSSGSGSPTVFVIQSGHTVTVNTAVSGIDTLIINGTLDMSNSMITMNANGKIWLGLTATGTIQNGTANSGFAWVNGSTTVKGPFNGSNLVTGTYRYATASTATAASGDPNTSFVSFTLAVDVATFTVTSNGTHHVASWTAEGTPAGDKFQISISTDGNNFTPYAQYDAIGDGGLQNYSCNIPKTGKTMYIKLSIIESTHTQEFKTLLANDKPQNVEAVKVFPTLIGSDNNNITVVLPNTGSYALNIYDASMRVIGTANYSTTQPNEIKLLDVNASGLTNSGTYYILISSAEGIISRIPVVVRK
jgi:hypothetical protein